MKKIKAKIKDKADQCSLCQANFQVWLNNLRINEERKEKISDHILVYCPACTRAGEK